ncbi:ADL001Cp [Eremothecium gossypii ATCC 10895]|uniref:Increased recombination centers protein 22 n=1 Tax=Eremothecium gossypii (strain ATCC 10895 / CBS 109.51 / FGSC 9923 / NRRL Y-1056) TaxID=284811 RepID=IRC22_EREGS|nr:ADL001Cp [Eremothecium gossypii ATCC 10895]Q8J1F5.1 RecName: Full=Increased recombination centers protein 22; Flags: Precursor [Eremothecium gossypii ATCC 10895]AAO16964.1 Yel001c [Eremothecium gossypii]AAS51920.1 ADL001Cp [Eremothecium gossypii ATCC 10895]AEY96220.1 FADL001Cp [Eremothecium gossypii FDAG1]
MKLSNLLLFANVGTLLVKATDENISPNEENTPRYAQFNIDYSVLDQPNYDPMAPMEFENGENITLAFNFANNEEVPVKLIAVGGNIINARSGDEVANITRSSLGEIEVDVNTSVSFNQAINLKLDEGDYFLLPNVFVLKEGELMAVGTSPSRIKILPPPMSFFNPKFLSIQAVLIGVISYFTYFIFRSSKKERRGVVSKTKAPKKVKLDESWLPENHLKK